MALMPLHTHFQSLSHKLYPHNNLHIYDKFTSCVFTIISHIILALNSIAKLLKFIKYMLHETKMYNKKISTWYVCDASPQQQSPYHHHRFFFFIFVSLYIDVMIEVNLFISSRFIKIKSCTALQREAKIRHQQKINQLKIQINRIKINLPEKKITKLFNHQ